MLSTTTTSQQKERNSRCDDNEPFQSTSSDCLGRTRSQHKPTDRKAPKQLYKTFQPKLTIKQTAGTDLFGSIPASPRKSFCAANSLALRTRYLGDRFLRTALRLATFRTRKKNSQEGHLQPENPCCGARSSHIRWIRPSRRRCRQPVALRYQTREHLLTRWSSIWGSGAAVICSLTFSTNLCCDTLREEA